MGLVAGTFTSARVRNFEKLMSDEKIVMDLGSVNSLQDLLSGADYSFYSLMVQAGYFKMEPSDRAGYCLLSVPNKDIKLSLGSYVQHNLFRTPASINFCEFFYDSNPFSFARNFGKFISDMLSYPDTTGDKELIYHILALGILAEPVAFDDERKFKFNIESEDGRYDIWTEERGRNYIFEFKRCDSDKDLDDYASKALDQIDKKRYGSGLNSLLPLWKVGIAFHGKQCMVKCLVKDFGFAKGLNIF
jgi:hypothetical protein